MSRRNSFLNYNVEKDQVHTRQEPSHIRDMYFRKTLLALMLTFSASLCSADEPLTFTVVADEWCPYNCEPDSETEGFGIEFLRAVYEPLGIKVDYRLVSWDKAIEDTRKGLYNAAISAYKSDARGFIFPDNAYAKSYVCFFVKPSNNWNFNGTDSLESQKIGVIKSYSYGNNIDSFIERNKQTHTLMVSGTEPLKELFQALKNNTITTIVEDEAVFKYMNQSKFPEFQTRQVGCQLPGQLYIAFSPARADSKKFAEIFDRGFEQLKGSDKYWEILNKYGLGR